MPEVTLAVDKVVDKDTRNGTIFIAHGSDGHEYNTKHAGMAKTLRSAAADGGQVSIEFTVLPGKERDDGSRWPDSRWIDKDGVTRVGGGSASPAATGSPAASAPAARGGDWSPEAREGAARTNAWKSACILYAHRETVTPKDLVTVAEFGVDFILGRIGKSAADGEAARAAELQAAAEAAAKAAAEAAAAAAPQSSVNPDDDIPF